MKNIILVTGNSRKVGEAQLALKDFGISVEQQKYDIDEIQSSDIILIAKQKAKDAYKLVKKPVVVTDTSWYITALNGFPGGYMKEVAHWLSTDDFLNLIKPYKDKSISFTETIVYQDDKQTKVFSQKFVGVFANKPRGSGNSIEQLAEFDGFTIGERQQQGRFSHDAKDYIWYQFGKWFASEK